MEVLTSGSKAPFDVGAPPKPSRGLLKKAVLKCLLPGEAGQAGGYHLSRLRVTTVPHIASWKPSWQTPGLNQYSSVRNARLEKTAYLKGKGTLGFIEFVPNSSTFNHPETVSLQATISFTNEGME